jgi:hypothetical protein
MSSYNAEQHIRRLENDRKHHRHTDTFDHKKSVHVKHIREVLEREEDEEWDDDYVPYDDEEVMDPLEEEWREYQKRHSQE